MINGQTFEEYEAECKAYRKEHGHTRPCPVMPFRTLPPLTEEGANIQRNLRGKHDRWVEAGRPKSLNWDVGDTPITRTSEILNEQRENVWNLFQDGHYDTNLEWEYFWHAVCEGVMEDYPASFDENDWLNVVAEVAKDLPTEMPEEATK